MAERCAADTTSLEDVEARVDLKAAACRLPIALLVDFAAWVTGEKLPKARQTALERALLKELNRCE